ncbi:MAG: serine/threonine-protein kinase [Verrucomicrobiota bacterium]
MSDSLEPAGFVAPEPADLAPLFPGYEIQGLIATGGMGAVYRAVQRSLDRTVALKILPMELSKDAAFCAGFEAEAKAMARLNHPNLIGVYDFGEVNGMLYIMMEFVAGKSIYHSAYGMAIDPQEVIRLVSGICSGLAHAHEHGIIHRDIKPSNILLDLNAQPKIGDFGLARPIERKVEEGEEIFGTPHYTAPEVVNHPHSVDHRADIFSVGVLLHELLTGKLPASDPRPASTIVQCDSRFDTIVRRATQPLAAARYSSAKEISHDLQVIAASLVPKVPRTAAIAAPRRVQPVRGRAPVRPQKSSSGSPMVVFILAAVAAIAAYAFYSKSQPDKAAVVPVVVQIPAPKDTDKQTTPVPNPSEDPQPTPPPDTTPVPKPDEVPDTGTVMEPDPGVTPVTPEEVAPKSDVTALFARARKVMLERTKPTITVYRSDLRANVAGFERSLKRQARKAKMTVAETDKAIEKAIAEWTANGGRIPEHLGETIGAIPEVTTVYDEAVQKQTGLDDTFQLELSKQAAFYITGLEKQIERLKLDNDVGAIKLIEAEIQQTKESPKYFSDLMMGAP